MKHRASIFYPAEAGASFDWDYYMNRHLPLAVGTSMRHSGIIACDADRPFQMSGNYAPHAAVCLVYFDGAQSMANFRSFFDTGHPDSADIGNDEHNYTTIAPLMVFSEYTEHSIEGGSDLELSCRMRFMFPSSGESAFDHDYFKAISEQVLIGRIAPYVNVRHAQIDRCTSDIPADSVPAYDAIWTLYGADREIGDAFLGFMDGEGGTAVREDLSRVSSRPPQIMVSELLRFDLAKTAPYKNR